MFWSFALAGSSKSNVSTRHLIAVHCKIGWMIPSSRSLCCRLRVTFLVPTVADNANTHTRTRTTTSTMLSAATEGSHTQTNSMAGEGGVGPVRALV